MKLIVAVDNRWGIGRNNDLLMRIPEDMKFFKKMTTDAVVIMGRKTLESFPGENPLPNRINIVITSDLNYKKEGVEIAHSIDEAVEIANKYNKEIFVIGGASIYKQMLSFCDTAYITKICKEFLDADTYFPNLNNIENWEMTYEGEPMIYNGVAFKFTTYENK